MFIDGMTAQIVNLLLKFNEPISTASIAEMIAVSQSSVKIHLDDAKNLVEATGGQLIKQPGVGIQLDATAQSKDKLAHILSQQTDHSYSYYYRRKYILDILFSGVQDYTIQLLADDLYVGKNIILKDIERIGHWLDHFEVSLEKRRHFGVALAGRESDIRQAIMEHNRGYGFPDNKEQEYDENVNLDYRIRQIFSNYMIKQYPGSDYYSLQDALLHAEKDLQVKYIDRLFGRLIEYLAITKLRVAHGNSIPKSETGGAGEIISQPAYKVAANVFAELKMIVTPSEVQNLAIYLLAFAKYQSPEFINEGDKDVLVSRQFIRSVGEIMSVSLETDQELISALTCFIKKFRVYHRYGLHMKSSFNTVIKKNSSSIYAVCIAAIQEIEAKLGFVLNDSEIAEIALIVSISVEKAKRPVEAILVTGTDGYTSQYIANRISSYVPELRFVAILSNDGSDQQPLPKGKLIISTVALRGDSIVLITKHVSANDVGKIQRALTTYQAKDVSSTQKLSFVQIFNKDAIVCDSNLKTRSEVISYGCELLRANGKVTGDFVASAIEREVSSPTAIGNGVAIPHGSQENILEACIAVIRLRHAIEWTDEDRVDIVFVLALKFDSATKIQGFFCNFYALIDNPSILSQLRKAKNKEQIWSTLVSFSLGDESR